MPLYGTEWHWRNVKMEAQEQNTVFSILKAGKWGLLPMQQAPF